MRRVKLNGTCQVMINSSHRFTKKDHNSMKTMALWAAAVNRGGGRGLVTAIPRTNLSRFSQGAAKDGDVRESKDDGGGSTAGFMVEKAKKGTRKAAEMVFETGESKAEGKKESWAYIKETTRKIKDDILGDTDNDHNERKRND